MTPAGAGAVRLNSGGGFAMDYSVPEVAARYLKLYTGVISDVLDRKGFRQQALPYYIMPLTPDMKVAGPAFTGYGRAVDDVSNDDSLRRVEMLDALPPHAVAVWSSGDHFLSAHWGEIMSNAARERGCVGAVVDGGVRDVRFILEIGFPVFARFRCSASSIGRWEIREWQVPIQIGSVTISPGDFVVGDVDGVVVVPRDLTLEVLEEAEAAVNREERMRAELRQGAPASEIYRKYGRF